MNELMKDVIEWADDRNLLRQENSNKQLDKTREEVEEVQLELDSGNLGNLALEIGDSGVTLIILARQNGLNFQQCIELAYEKIKNRTGKTVNGTFVKDHD